VHFVKKQVNPIVVGAILVLVVGALAYFGWRAMSPAEPAAGSYTPGKPPWLDPKSAQYKAGQGGPTGGAPSPPVAAPVAQPQGSSSGG
jgi:hypothetical protein